MALRKMRSALVLVLVGTALVAATFVVRSTDGQQQDAGNEFVHDRSKLRFLEGPKDRSQETRLTEGRPLNGNPEHVSAQDAPLGNGDLVMGVVIHGEARAYPLNYMNGPLNEIVNDTLGGKPIAPTW